jgi:pyruvate/2-oxoglutarate dehydrogenase complex dihydrolipoamide dehydrogenase (E3) component
MFKNRPLLCAINSSCGREDENQIKPSQISKEVIIVGGGPSGLEAARVSALRGHRVMLFEKESRLGGLLVPASLPPQKEDIERLITYLRTQIKKNSVRVRLHEEISPNDVINLHPDAVVVACGSSPNMPKIDGLKYAQPIFAEEALLGKAEIGENVIIIGGGLIGCETANFFSEKGKKITIIEILEKMASDSMPILRRLLLDRLKKKGVTMYVGVNGEKIEAKRVIFRNLEGIEQVIKFDTIILAAGRSPRKGNWEILRSKIREVYFVGDVVSPRGILEAISEANGIGRLL